MKLLKYTIVLFSILTAFIIAGCSSKSDRDKSGESANTQMELNSGNKTDKNTTDLADGLYTIIDFSATWCGPCKMIAPLVHRTAEEYEGKINFEFIDVDENPGMANQYGISSIPTFVVLDPAGQEVSRLNGADPEGFKQLVNSCLN